MVRLLALAAALPLLVSHACAQAVWSGADDRGSFWSYGKVVDDKGNVIHVGNWSGGLAPGTGGLFDVYLGAPGTTLCNVRATLNSLTLAPGGALNIDTSAALTVTTTVIQRDGGITEGGYAGGQAGSYTNAGTFTKTAGTGTFALGPSLSFVSLPGSTIAANSGTLQLSGSGYLYDTVAFVPTAGATISLVTPDTPGYSYSGHFQGTLSNGAGTGTVLLSGGTMLGTQRFLDSPQPCTLAFTGSVFQWTGGYIGGYQQGAIFTNTGVVNIAGDAAKETDAAFTNQGLVTQSGTGVFNVGYFNSGGSFTNAAGATYDLQSDAPIGQSGYPFNNLGLFKKSGGTGTSTMTVSFRNQGGTVEVDSGTLQLPLDNITGTSTGGTFNVAGGALLDLGGNAILTGTYTGGGGGTVRLSQGYIFADKPNATVFNFPGAMFQWTGGTIGAYQGGQVFTNIGVINLNGDGEKLNLAVFTNQGIIIQTGTGAFNIGVANSGGSFTNAAGATYNLASDASIGQSGYSFKNAGLFEKTAGTGVSKVDLELTNTGTISVDTGTLNFTQRINDITGTTLTEGTWNVADGATLSFQNYDTLTVNQANVTLSGINSSFPAFRSLSDNQGTFALLALRQFATVGNLANEGTLSLDAGSTLHVGGDFTASGANSTLAVTIGGTARQGSGSPGVLQSNGAATLAGTLALTFARNAVLPGSGDTLTVLSASASISGSFANVASGSRLSTTDGGGSFRVNYGAGNNTVVLSDFLLPGQVDAMPTVTLSALVPSVKANSGQDGEFLLTLSSAPSTDVVIDFTIKGTAINGTDYTLLKASKKIKAGKTSKPIKIFPQGDLGGASKKTVVLTLLPGDGYQVGTTAKVKVKITAP